MLKRLLMVGGLVLTKAAMMTPSFCRRPVLHASGRLFAAALSLDAMTEEEK